MLRILNKNSCLYKVFMLTSLYSNKFKGDKMKKYDLFTIIKPNLDNDEADKVVSRVEEIVKTLGGSVISCDKMGRKKLAYDVAGFSDGFMTNQVVSVPADKIVELKRQIKLNDSIIRTMFTTKESK